MPTMGVRDRRLLLPRSGIKLFKNTDVRLKRRHLVYHSAGDPSSQGMANLISKSVRFYRLFFSVRSLSRELLT